ncbi:MAG: glycosyltransferase [Coleofasciculus sp. A1-SPW-01]|uniref:glycosyltransferase family 2 protein n=1 Tax=Coleofasciculus sp. A1-SPW-01 TaxID=3070819 RepID=UPI0032FACD67
MKQEQIFFSIIIPTYNRPERLTTCLDAIAYLDYTRDRFEVIVVDDGSHTPIEPVVTPFRQQLDITLITQSNAGPATARNTGAAKAKGKFLVFTDDDCTPDPDWLKALAHHFTTAPDRLIGGRAINALPDNLFSTASQLLIDYLYDYYNTDPNQATFFASNNFALAKETFHQLGGFDITFPLAAGEDREWCDRWLNHGYRMIYAPKAQVYHAHHLTLKRFWRQHFNYGRGAFHFHQLRAKRNLDKMKVEPLSFYSNLLIYPFFQHSKQPSVLLSILLFLSQIANVVGFFWERSAQTSTVKHQPSQTACD